jgi:DNA-binding transcriptional LysR family regulator
MMNAAQLLRIDLSLLVLFNTVLAEGHVARAADKLNLTPSAVSHGLKRLRRLMQDPLFLKTPKGVKPTERALTLAAPIADILMRVDTVFSASGPFDPKSAERRFSIGAPDGLSAIFATPLLELLAREAPGIDIRLLHLMPQHHGKPTTAVWGPVLAELDAQRLDLVVLPIGPPPARFVGRMLFEEEFIVTMRAGHPFGRDPTLTSYLAMRHLLVSAIGDAHGLVDERLAGQGLSRRVALTVPNFMMALNQLAETDLVATLPRRLVMRHAARFGLVVAPPPFPWMKDPVRVVTSRASMADPGIAWMFDAVVRCFEQSGDSEATSTGKGRRRDRSRRTEARSAPS